MFWLDTAILAVLGIGAGLGFWSGLLWQVARVVSLGLAFYATVVLNEPVSALLAERVLQGVDAHIVHGVAYVAVFVAVYLALFMLTRLLHHSIKAARLETVDRLLGAALGAAKMALVVAAVCALLASLGLPATQSWMAESRLAPAFARGTDAALQWVPDDYRTQATDGVAQVRDLLQRKAVDHALDQAAGKGN